VEKTGSMMSKLLEVLLWRRWGRRCRSPLSHYCDRCGVDDAETSRAGAMGKPGLMMMEPLSHCCGEGGDDDVEALRGVAVVETGSMILEPLKLLL
jgi:hypothetical protein